MNVAEFQQLRDRLESLRSDYDQATGAVKEAVKSLKRNHGCATLEEANENIKQLEAKLAELLAKRNKLIQKFEDKWHEQLEELA